MHRSPAVLDGRAAAAVPRPPTRPTTQPEAPRLATELRAAAHPAAPEVTHHKAVPHVYPARIRAIPTPDMSLCPVYSVLTKWGCALLPHAQACLWHDDPKEES